MNLKLLFLALSAIPTVIVQGQNQVQGYILDKKTFEPLPYATIADKNMQYGSFTDTSGMFVLNFLSGNDSLKVSYLGYKGLITTVRDLQNNSKIFLEAKPVQIKELAVSQKKSKPKKIEIGYFSKKPCPSVNVSYSITTVATYIPYPQQEGNIVIEAVKFNYRSAVKNSPLRIRVLTVRNNGEPGEDMIEDNIIFNNFKQGQNEFAIIDISGYNIIMPQNGVFIGIEYLDMGRTYEPKDNKSGLMGPYLGTIKTGDSSKSNWGNTYNYPEWKKLTYLPFTFTIGLSVVNYWQPAQSEDLFFR